MSYETYHIPVNFTDAGKLFGVFEIRNAVETVLLCIPILFLCLALLPLTLMPKIIVTMTILVPVGGFALIGIGGDSLTRWLKAWINWRKHRRMIFYRGGASMSMKDAIFGTAAPTSHGGATYRDSIQAWLPVKNIIGGVVITKDNRFIKILEVLPVNFYLKSPSDQQNIITSYAAYLKIAPDSMSCEVRTLPPDTSEYVEQMRQFQKTEESENCRAEIEDNIEKIGLGIASESIRHRFFLVFQYEAKMRAKRNTVKSIIQRLNEEADTARRYLDICELEVLEPRYTDDFVLKLLYELINKGTSLRVKLPEGVFDMTTEVHGVYGE